MTKVSLRREISKKRKALITSELTAMSEKVVSNFLLLDVFSGSNSVALYKAIGGEADLEPLFEICWRLNKRTAIPVFNTDTRVYEMAEITAATEFAAGNYGILEPIAPRIIEIGAIDLMAVPGVGFDLAGNRLGRGGGFYDRMLEHFSGAAAGIAFEFQLFEEIPVAPHDLPVDYLVTETKHLKVPNER